MNGKMKFTDEFRIIENLDQKLSYLIEYQFNGLRIKLYVRFDKRSMNKKMHREYLILTVDSGKKFLIHPYNIFGPDKGEYRINGFLGPGLSAAPNLLIDKSLKDFYKTLKKAIHSIDSTDISDIKVSILDPEIADEAINEATIKSNNALKTNNKLASRNRFFWYTKSAESISKTQEVKIKSLLGKEALFYLKDHKLNAVFSSHPEKQRTLNFTDRQYYSN